MQKHRVAPKGVGGMGGALLDGVCGHPLHADTVALVLDRLVDAPPPWRLPRCSVDAAQQRRELLPYQIVIWHCFAIRTR